MDDLHGKVAVVTGSASGIGRGIALRLADAGMKVVAADIDAAGAARTRDEIAGRGGRALAVRTDVADPQSVEELAATTLREMGGVHVVCNNAGVAVGGLLLEATEDDWRWLFSVNFGGVLNGCRAFVPRLIEQGQGGHIVNTASMGGVLSGGGLGAYCTTKYAIVALSEALRLEIESHGIGVSILYPGAYRTQLADAARNRPTGFGTAGGSTDGLRAMLEPGDDPVLAGEHVLRGIRENAPHVFTHAEYRPFVAARFEQILAAFDR